MLPEFPMKSFFHAAILSLGLLPGIISTGTAQDFGAMSFGGAGDFGTPQARPGPRWNPTQRNLS